MKLMQRKHITRWILSAMFVLGMIFSMKSVTAFAADEETQTIYIGGNKLTVPIEEASYWNYNEVDGTITDCAEQEANVLINTVGKYGDPALSIYVNLVNVNIKAKGGAEDFSNAGIYNPEQETKMYLRINEIVALPVPSMEFMQKLMLHRVMRKPDLRLQQIVVLLLQAWMFKKQFPCIRQGRIIFTGGMGIQIFQ